MSTARLSEADRKIVAKRAGYLCEYCRSQLKFSPDPFSVEHIMPRSAGGTDVLDNLALSCQGCNNRKYTSTEAADPVSGRMAPLFNPRVDEWRQHFAWSNDYSRIVGLTPTGRATVSKLEMNRDGLVNLRRVLYAGGEHPP